ncbi:unnamed protein product [Calypogeia fissa]
MEERGTRLTAQTSPKPAVYHQAEILQWPQWWGDYNKDSLLPGLPNDITINHVLTKLPGRYMHLLASLSTCWQQAVRSKDVFDARIRAGCAHSAPLTASRFYALKSDGEEKEKVSPNRLAPAARFYSRGRGKRVHAVPR